MGPQWLKGGVFFYLKEVDLMSNKHDATAPEVNPDEGNEERIAPVDDVREEDKKGAENTDWEQRYRDMRAHSREWEKRAKENAKKAARLDQIEEEQKTELERATDERDALRAELAQERLARTRAEIAQEFGISADDRDLYLTSEDEDTLRRQAEGLANRRGPRARAENPAQGAASSDAGKDARSWADRLLNRK